MINELENHTYIYLDDLTDVKQIKFTVTFTKDNGVTMAKDFINLQRDKLYYLPFKVSIPNNPDIKAKDISLKNYTFFKTNPDIMDVCIIRNINNGLITLYPIIHSTQLKGGTYLGELI